MLSKHQSEGNISSLKHLHRSIVKTDVIEIKHGICSLKRD